MKFQLEKKRRKAKRGEVKRGEAKRRFETDEVLED